MFDRTLHISATGIYTSVLMKEIFASLGVHVLNCFWFSEMHFSGVSLGRDVRVLALDGAFSFPGRCVLREFGFFPRQCCIATGSCCVLLVFSTWAVSRHSEGILFMVGGGL